MRGFVIALMAVGLLLPTSPLVGQVAWDAPLMVGTASPTGWGLYLSDPSPGAGIGVFTTWRTGDTYGLRIGIAEDSSDDIAVFGGLDVSGELLRSSDELELEVRWVTGGGFGIGDSTLLSFPLGVSVGREFLADNLRFAPYLAPRVILDAYLGDESSEDGLGLEFAVDLGFDMAFESGWTVRFAGSIGDREALAIGINFLIF